MPKQMNQDDLRSWAAPALKQEIERLNVLLKACEGPPARRQAPQAKPRKQRKPMSAASRKAASARMKAYWAERRKKEK
jgi:hypothetical protein